LDWLISAKLFTRNQLEEEGFSPFSCLENSIARPAKKQQDEHPQ
jgi:hypothetical protein